MSEKERKTVPKFESLLAGTLLWEEDLCHCNVLCNCIANTIASISIGLWPMVTLAALLIFVWILELVLSFFHYFVVVSRSFLLPIFAKACLNA